jgi:hypothetical protein
MRKQYRATFKAQVVQDVFKGDKTIAQLASEHGVHPNLISLWKATAPERWRCSSLYYRPVPPSPEELALKHRIDEIFTAHPFYGSRLITAQLRRDAVVVNRKAIQPHMREMSIEAIGPKPNPSKSASERRVFPYLLGDIVATAPNHVWGLTSRPFAWRKAGCISSRSWIDSRGLSSPGNWIRCWISTLSSPQSIAT